MWKRLRERWRKLPVPRDHGPKFGTHWGRYQKIPKVPGGPEISLSTSGRVDESRPWPLWKWIVALGVGTLVAAFVFPALFTWLFWACLGVLLMVLTYRQWRG